MFETMSSFLWFFFIFLAMIVFGILFEEKLIAFEYAIRQFAKQKTARFVKGLVRFVRLCRDDWSSRNIAKKTAARKELVK